MMTLHSRVTFACSDQRSRYKANLFTNRKCRSCTVLKLQVFWDGIVDGWPAPKVTKYVNYNCHLNNEVSTDTVPYPQNINAKDMVTGSCTYGSHVVGWLWPWWGCGLGRGLAPSPVYHNKVILSPPNTLFLLPVPIIDTRLHRSYTARIFKKCTRV